MIRNRKGVGSFMESIAAIMVVTVALTSFLGLLALSELTEEKENVEIDMHFLDKLSISNNKIIGDVDEHLAEICEKNGYSKIALTINPIGFDIESASFYFGTNETENYRYFSGNINIETDKNEIILASYEMVVFL